MNAAEITWEPGSLKNRDLQRIIRDGLADLWRDSWRQSDTRALEGQRSRFCTILEAEAHAATGHRVRVEVLP